MEIIDKARRLARKKRPDVKDVFTLSGERYDTQRALLAHGIARFILAQGGVGARATLEAFGEAQFEKSGKGVNPRVELSPEEQDAILREHLGEDWERRVLKHMAESKRARD